MPLSVENLQRMLEIDKYLVKMWKEV